MSDTNQVDFTKFVDANKGTVDFSTPFVHDGWLYATDGIICIRKPMPMACNTDGTFPTAWKLKEWEHFPLTDAKELAAIKLDLCNCDECDGVGFLYECPECDGDGDVYWEGEYSNHEYYEQCNVCRGDCEIKESRCKAFGISVNLLKKVKCGNCEGTGKTYADSRVSVDGFKFQTSFMAKVIELPNVRYKIVKVENPSAYYHNDMMLFESGDVQGVFIADQ